MAGLGAASGNVALLGSFRSKGEKVEGAGLGIRENVKAEFAGGGNGGLPDAVQTAPFGTEKAEAER
jgi:hypothetical protein